MTIRAPVAIDVRLRTAWVENAGYRHDVLLDGDVIVRRSRDPEHDAARVLHARGLHGQFRTIDFRTGRPRMILDIEKAARLRTVERNDTGLVVVAYRAMSDEDKARARMQRSDLGRPAPPVRVQDRGRPQTHRRSARCNGAQGPAANGCQRQSRAHVRSGTRCSA